MTDVIQQAWPPLAAALLIVCDLAAAGHAILYKRDPRSAAAWIGIILLFPIAGAVLYVFLGINRIQRRASRLRPKAPGAATIADLASESEFVTGPLAPLARSVHAVTGLPLLPGNRFEALRNGDEAYPAMLDAIRHATSSISLSTYIFANDATGRLFADALGDAVGRGVDVRVLIDDVGARYSLPTIHGVLARRGVRTERFLPTFFHWRLPYINLRNHRKILVVDGTVGFTGGLNLRHNNVVSAGGRDATQDLHFRVRGPVVRQLQECFAEDWAFSTGERIEGARWFPPLRAEGGSLARGIADGPDEDFDTLRTVILSALAGATRSVRIATPYFLPDPALISQLNVAAMRGVDVEILIPEHNNLRLVGWACTAQLWQVLQRGCRVWCVQPPFSHAKAMIVDDQWSMIGSSNWDARSLRLNFEFNVEIYDPAFAETLADLLEVYRATAREITLREVDGRPLPIRLRDGAARLLWPYL